MSDVIFVTGNQNKADYLAKLLGMSLEHQALDLDELQTLDLHELVTHKVKQAYDQVRQPVLVEDVSLEFVALGGLPGPFNKFFVEYAGLEPMCRMLDGLGNREAIARCTFGFYDGKELTLFDGASKGTIAAQPHGDNGYGWDKIFQPDGYDGKTSAELSLSDNEKVYLVTKPINQVREFLFQRSKVTL